MDRREIIEKYESEDVKSIFGYMYGRQFVNAFRNGRLEREKDRIIKIKKEALELSRNRDGFFYVWGFPGPNYNFYKFSDYGITWAFTQEEIHPTEEATNG